MAHRPDLVAGRDVVDKDLLGLLLQELPLDGVGDVNVKLRVIRKDQRHMDPVSQGAREHGGRDRAVAMDEIKVSFHQRLERLARKRQSRMIADQFCKVDARVAHDGEFKLTVVRAGVGRRDDGRFLSILRQNFRIVYNRVRHSIGDGRKGIVDQADASLFHGDFSFLSANDVELLYRAFRKKESTKTGTCFCSADAS